MIHKDYWGTNGAHCSVNLKHDGDSVEEDRFIILKRLCDLGFNPYQCAYKMHHDMIGAMWMMMEEKEGIGAVYADQTKILDGMIDIFSDDSNTSKFKTWKAALILPELKALRATYQIT